MLYDIFVLMVSRFCVSQYYGNLTGITMTGPVNSVVSNTDCHSDYQVLYELPLVTMTTSGTLPAVAPVQPIILYRGNHTIPLDAH